MPNDDYILALVISVLAIALALCGIILPVSDGDIIINPSCKAYGTGFQTVNHATWTEGVLTHVLWDECSDVDLANNQIVISRNGSYLVTGQGVLQLLGDGCKLLVGIFVNDVQRAQNRFTVGASDTCGAGVATLLKLWKGDYVQIKMYHNHGSPRSWYGGENARDLGCQFLSDLS